MSKLWIPFFALVALTVSTGCGGGENSEQPTPSSRLEVPATTPAETGTAAQTASMTVEGQLGCGHCSHQIGTSCSAAVQTAEGKVYILEDMAAGSEPFDQRFGQKKIRVTGTVTVNEGVSTMKVTDYQLL